VSRSIAEVLAEARRRLPDRPGPAEVEEALARGELVVDIRPIAQRRSDGEIPGATVIDRNVLEWRLDPASPDRIDATSYDRAVVVVCNEGYASTLAAVGLLDLGLRATDLDGGFQAWARSGRPVTFPGTGGGTR
jgi:rhodanese-related sulfurtransferase